MNIISNSIQVLDSQLVSYLVMTLAFQAQKKMQLVRVLALLFFNILQKKMKLIQAQKHGKSLKLFFETRAPNEMMELLCATFQLHTSHSTPALFHQCGNLDLLMKQLVYIDIYIYPAKNFLTRKLKRTISGSVI